MTNAIENCATLGQFTYFLTITDLEHKWYARDVVAVFPTDGSIVLWQMFNDVVFCVVPWLGV